ncbi:Trehalose phosphorylase [Choanephora cucurbitarum]|uniref:Trehalose phosphorylase n=1 Tax=Choanephora cucurbitarum TaxID=101091 RepID=A0A1C7N2C4_9FUNG|nr:Trehalose phosphorylase [Choanephora cucurbitarum]
MPPSPTRVPIRRTSRRFSSAHVPMPVYLGVDFEIRDDNTSWYAISVHDGMYSTDYYQGELKKHDPSKSPKEIIIEAFVKLHEIVQLYSMAQNYKVQLVACSYDIGNRLLKTNEELIDFEEIYTMSDYWQELDALPFRVETHAVSADERASAAVRKAVMWLSPKYPGNLPRISVGYRHEVEVDFNHSITMVNCLDYQKTVRKQTWDLFQNMVSQFKERNLKVSFFNSTPQGGGVALMRHALIRLLHLNGVDVHWYVARPKPEVFDITKRKFHNVLQGVADSSVWLTDEDKQAFIDWSDENVRRFWLDDNGPIKTSDVIVIDDPQVSGIIPYIRQYAPNTRIIFRSHIEVRSDLIQNQPEGSTANTWNFLWDFIKLADIFVAHPIKGFVPDVVPPENTVLLPAATDPLDGLNKPMNDWCITYYQSVFNRVCVDCGVNEVDWNRPYIVQVARFDPSKGIPDVLEAYRLLRLKMDGEFEDHRTPQLVICGHGSIDDPDGTLIFEQVQNTIESTKFAFIASDIIAVRLPPSDQLLNMIMRCSYVALQLSHREGFEVKVTEALHKGIPVVAYKAGGIPLQIEHEKSGFLLPIGDVEQVADVLYRLFKEPELHRKMSANAKACVTEEFFTIWNAMSWLHMFLELTGHQSDEMHQNGGLLNLSTLKHTTLGDQRKVSETWREKYNYDDSL